MSGNEQRRSTQMENDRPLATPYLSKSLYIKGLQCHKALWLHKNRPELKAKPSAAQQAAFDSGTDVGILAQRLFPDGVLVPYDGLSHAEQLALTEEAMNRDEKTIYEATFSFDNMFVKVDILHRGETGWEIYEVKSSNECKDVHLKDIAVQQYVLAGSGLPITRACLIHINKRYVLNGDIEVEKLFTIKDVTEKILSLQTSVPGNLTAMRGALGEDMPTIDIGPHCKEPYACDFKGHCWEHIPKNSVFDLGGNGVNKFAQYRNGIVRLEDVPLDILPRRQRIQARAFQTRQNHIDIEAVRKFLATLWYPLCFLDFETTYMTPVPLFDRTRPYQQVPFQYSLHTLAYEGAELEHREFLAQPGENPQSAFIASLLAILPDNACILAYNQKFEIGRMKELAESFPEHKERIAVLNSNFRDLMKPFESRTIYFPEMGGSYSIKAVLPALVPELGYKDLEVSNGAMAAEAYLRMLQMDDPDEISRTRVALLEYCKLDTLAMVRILEKMREMVM
jgi:hypothetical protein